MEDGNKYSVFNSKPMSEQTIRALCGFDTPREKPRFYFSVIWSIKRFVRGIVYRIKGAYNCLRHGESGNPNWHVYD